MASEIDYKNASGLEILQGLMSGIMPMPEGMFHTLNFEPIEAGEGMCVVEGIATPAHYNPHGTVHGGWAMSVLDTAASLAVFSALPSGLMSATATMEVKLIAPIRAGIIYHAHGEILSIGNRLGHAKADMYDAETQERVAYATASCAIFSRGRDERSGEEE